MKKILFLFVCSLVIISCELEGGPNGFTLEALPISTVEMPNKFKVDSTSVIAVSYTRPSACYEFSNFYYNSFGSERTVAVYCRKFSGNQCENVIPTDYQETVPLNFRPTESGTYHFRFWMGVDPNGADQYMEHEITVNN